MDSAEYREQRVAPQIDWYDGKSSLNQRVYKTLRLAEIIIAALIVFAGALLSVVQRRAVWARSRSGS